MNRIFVLLAALTISISASALDHVPTEYQVLTHAEGPAIAVHLGNIDWTQLVFADNKCNSSVDYAGDTKLTMGTETYKLVSVVRTDGAFCPGAFHLQDHDSFTLLFVNVNFGNQIGLSLDKETLPEVELILGRGVVAPGRALN